MEDERAVKSSMLDGATASEKRVRFREKVEFAEIPCENRVNDFQRNKLHFKCLINRIEMLLLNGNQ